MRICQLYFINHLSAQKERNPYCLRSTSVLRIACLRMTSQVCLLSTTNFVRRSIGKTCGHRDARVQRDLIPNSGGHPTCFDGFLVPSINATGCGSWQFCLFLPAAVLSPPLSSRSAQGELVWRGVIWEERKICTFFASILFIIWVHRKVQRDIGSVLAQMAFPLHASEISDKSETGREKHVSVPHFFPFIFFCTGGAKMWRFSGRMWQKTSQFK